MDNIPVPLYGDGGNIRDWLHVLDHCRAIDLLMHTATNGEVYNIGGGNEVKNIDLTHKVLKLAGKGPELIKPVAGSQGPRSPLQPRHRQAARHGLGAAGGVRSRACARRWPGTRRTNGGGGRSRNATPATRPTSKRNTASADGACVLVTGAAGFVGSHLLELLEQDDDADRRLAAARHRAARCSGTRVSWHVGRDARSRRRWPRRSTAFAPDADLSPRRRAARRRLVGAHPRNVRRQRPRHASPVRRAAPRMR